MLPAGQEDRTSTLKSSFLTRGVHSQQRAAEMDEDEKTRHENFRRQNGRTQLRISSDEFSLCTCPQRCLGMELDLEKRLALLSQMSQAHVIDGRPALSLDPGIKGRNRTRKNEQVALARDASVR